ncbi:hypothetical protein F4782DRAFT_528620 [Xylaria castorea]|nr:hypothetical protein F4782DRAFT_528620 [Xylaria castorea]
MSSPNKSALPLKPPLNATNSWVVSRAREFIGYDAYGTVEQWLDDVTDDGENENDNNNNGSRSGNNTSKSPTGDHGSSRRGHPAGELEDYDPDCTLFSQKTIIEVLEAAAAEMEAGHSSDSDGAVQPPERWDNAYSSSLASSCYGYLPSDSLEGEPLLDVQLQDLRDTNPRPMTDEKSNTESDGMMDSPISFLGPGALPLPLSSSSTSCTTVASLDTRSEKEVLTGLTPTRNFPRAHSTVSPPSSSDSKSQFLIVPLPTHTTAPSRARARAWQNIPNQAGKYPLSHPRSRPDTPNHKYTFVKLFPHPEIERCASPMPRFRGESPYPVSPDSELPPTSSPSVASISSSYHGALETQGPGDTPTWPVLSVSESERAPDPSPFPGRRRFGGEVHMSTVDEDMDEDGGVEMGRLRIGRS